MQEPTSPQKKQFKAPPAKPPAPNQTQTTPQAPSTPLAVNPMENLTPTELLDGLSQVLEQLQALIENPTKKPITEEINAQMEKIRQMSGFLSAVYANMIRIAVEEEGATPQPPTEEQRALARRTEALGWRLRALQEKAAVRMSPPPPPKAPIPVKKRKTRMERTQGDSEWKRM